MAMKSQIRQIPKPIAVGAIFALLSILFGFGLGIVFGAFEANLKKQLEASGTAALQSVYQGDVAAKDAVVKKSFDYVVRAHLHGGGIGGAALGAIAALILLTSLGLVAQASAVAFGAGALLYSIFWLWAGFLAPGLGGTGAAKEALNFIAMPGAGLAIAGAAGTLYSVVKDGLFSR